MMWWNDGWGWWGWAGMTFSMLVFWGLVIWGLIVLVRYLSTQTDNGAGSARRDTPEEILANRFSRGDIDEGEFEHRLEILRSSGTGRGRSVQAENRETELVRK